MQAYEVRALMGKSEVKQLYYKTREEIYKAIKAAATKGESEIIWCNGGDLDIGRQFPAPWPSNIMIEELRKNGFAVTETTYPQSGLAYLTVSWL